MDLSRRLSYSTSESELAKSSVLCVVVVGGTSRVALQKTYPAIYKLFNSKLLPDENLHVIGYTRSKDLTNEDLRALVLPQLGAGDKDGFLSKMTCFHGQHGSASDFAALDDVCSTLEGLSGNRLYYFAHGGEYFAQTALAIKATKAKRQLRSGCTGWMRVVVEKPLGRDAESAAALSAVFDSCIGEENLFRMDHYAGKEAVQSILALRFSNAFLEPVWNSNHIQAVHISLTEDFGVDGIGENNVKGAGDDANGETFARYFDEYGVVRDLIMDHLMPLLCLVAMEPPLSRHAEDVRDERLKVMRAIAPLRLQDTVLGQYDGYRELSGVDDDSTTPTYATIVLYIRNSRWWGVPFIITAGKAMHERTSEVRVQFKRPATLVYEDQRERLRRNELVIRIHPEPNIEFNMMAKIPGVHSVLGQKTMDMTVGAEKAQTFAPQDYDRLVYDVVRGKRTAFVRADEHAAMWKVFGPALKHMDVESMHPLTYAAGSDGPVGAAEALYQRCDLELASQVALDRPLVVQNAVQKLQRQFFLSSDMMVELVNNFHKEFTAGLAGEASTIRMLPSYVQALPNGSETGVYYALDLGGTNFRVSRFEFLGAGVANLTDERKFTVPDSAMTASTADGLFDFLAECMTHVTSEEDGPDGGKYGFTFSFPVEQDAVDQGRLITWTKAFKTGGVVGEEVVALLKKSLLKVGLKASITALVNDTVGTLAAKAFTAPRCMIGLILGTGTNAAYVEKVENILKLPEEMRKQGGDMVINTEWGAFGEGNSRLLPVTGVDVTIDRESRNPGQQTFEKMISGAYLGEITRLCMLRLRDEGALWCGEDSEDEEDVVVIPDSVLKRNGFESRYMSNIEYDMSPDLSVVKHVESLLGIKGSSLQDRQVVQEVCAMVVERAARLTACGVTAATRQLGSRGVGCTVGIDGSVFELHPTFADRLRNALKTLGCNVEVALSKDGSGKGAALIAASLDREMKEGKA